MTIFKYSLTPWEQDPEFPGNPARLTVPTLTVEAETPEKGWEEATKLLKPGQAIMAWNEVPPEWKNPEYWKSFANLTKEQLDKLTR